MSPTIALRGHRLAFSVATTSGGIYRFVPGHPPDPVLVSSAGDAESSFSPDGTRLVFGSTRSSDGRAIWIADADGSHAQQLTPHRPDQYQGSPSWSPDGRRVAFDERAADGNWHVWTIDASGGSPQQLTIQPGNQSMPSWSHDGQWVYFLAVANRGENRVWRIPAEGGKPEQLIHDAGGFSREAPDGRSLLYLRGPFEAPLLIAPLTGGPSRVLVESVLGRSVAVGRTDVYYVCESGGTQILHKLNLTTREDRILGTLDHAMSTGIIAVSPDETTILYDRHQELGMDLMMIENFH
jgi:Tol biopolymer transport system component